MRKLRDFFALLLRWRFFPALMIALALAAGMLLPSAVLSVQDAHLEKSDTLLPTGISVGRQSSEAAKLDILRLYYNTIVNGNGDELGLSRGRYMTAEQAMEHISELSSIAAAAGLCFDTPPDSAECRTSPVLVVLSDSLGMTSSIAWVVQFYWDENTVGFVLDDETGIILSADIYYDVYDGQTQPASGDIVGQAQLFADALCRSYGFESVTAEAKLSFAEGAYSSCDIFFTLDGKPQFSMQLSLNGQNWNFGI